MANNELAMDWRRRPPIGNPDGELIDTRLIGPGYGWRVAMTAGHSR